MKKRKVFNLKLTHLLAAVLLSVFTVAGCGGGGGGSSNPTPQTQSSDWDTMSWDQGHWQ